MSVVKDFAEPILFSFTAMLLPISSMCVFTRVLKEKFTEIKKYLPIWAGLYSFSFILAFYWCTFSRVKVNCMALYRQSHDIMTANLCWYNCDTFFVKGSSCYFSLSLDLLHCNHITSMQGDYARFLSQWNRNCKKN